MESINPMQDPEQPIQPKSDTAFKAVAAFNQTGYAFQRAVLAETERLVSAANSPWFFQAEEFPISLGPKSARIDFVLKHRDLPWYLIAECKRAGPSNGWCFATSKYVRRNNSPSEIVVDAVYKHEQLGSVIRRRAGLDMAAGTVFHQGVAFQSAELSESKQQRKDDREAIENASNQVFVGVSGFIEWLQIAGEAWPEPEAVVIPVIFTTAPLRALQCDLSDADLQSGNLPESTAVEDVDWLWLRQHVSPALTSAVPIFPSQFEKNLGKNLSRYLDNMYSRTVAVVQPSGIQSFLLQAGACTQDASW